MVDRHTKDMTSNKAGDDLSTTENQWGVDLNTAKPIALIGLSFSIPLLLIGLLVLTQTGSFSGFILLTISCFGVVLSYFFQLSEKQNHELDQRLGELTEDNDEIPENKILVCRECHGEVSKDAKRCPHCGWKPEKKSGLYKGTAGVLGLTFIGTPLSVVMGKRAVEHGVKARKGVGKEVEIDKEETNSDTTNDNPVSEDDPITSLERLSRLWEQGAITETEFEEQKAKLLDKIQ